MEGFNNKEAKKKKARSFEGAKKEEQKSENKVGRGNFEKKKEAGIVEEKTENKKKDIEKQEFDFKSEDDLESGFDKFLKGSEVRLSNLEIFYSRTVEFIEKIENKEEREKKKEGLKKWKERKERELLENYSTESEYEFQVGEFCEIDNELDELKNEKGKFKEFFLKFWDKSADELKKSKDWMISKTGKLGASGGEYLRAGGVAALWGGGLYGAYLLAKTFLPAYIFWKYIVKPEMKIK